MENIVYQYFDLSEDKKDKIDRMLDVYQVWNKKVNLISRKDVHYFYERHVLHSLAICHFFSFKDKSNIMDLGTGGGFPGVPLAIMFPEVQFSLVDSISKKTTVLNEIVKELDLANVNIFNQRVEDIDDNFDFIVCRAVAKLNQLTKWTKGKISRKQNHEFQNGLICLKGGDLTQEIKQVSGYVDVYSISDFFKEEFFLEKKVIHLTI